MDEDGFTPEPEPRGGKTLDDKKSIFEDTTSSSGSDKESDGEAAKTERNTENVEFFTLDGATTELGAAPSTPDRVIEGKEEVNDRVIEIKEEVNDIITEGVNPNYTADALDLFGAEARPEEQVEEESESDDNEEEEEEAEEEEGEEESSEDEAEEPPSMFAQSF